MVKVSRVTIKEEQVHNVQTRKKKSRRLKISQKKGRKSENKMEYLQDKYIKSIKYEDRLKPKYICGYIKYKLNFSKRQKQVIKKQNPLLIKQI